MFGLVVAIRDDELDLLVHHEDGTSEDLTVFQDGVILVERG